MRSAVAWHLIVRMRRSSLLTGALIWQVAFVAVLFVAAIFGIFSYAIDKGNDLVLAQTMAMNMVVVLEIFYLFFIRNVFGTSLTWAAIRGTNAVWICVAIVVPAQFVVTYLPLAQGIFGTASVSLTDGLLIVGIGAVFFAIIEVEKQIRLSLSAPDDQPLISDVKG
ncbi:cation transporting ATPase C-terminal domain-containing protein [Mesorhizobium sp. VNQ89]|uniref:cation transporting ATPase C-terminal domain-containing protein n=1 Tax=Mesorhizobium quangtriensis TaxID=3157709 RepID=UPI0032B79E61